MTVATARTLLSLAARSAGSTSDYTATELDYANQTIADDFLLETRALKQVDSVALTASSATLPTLPTGFRPDLALQAWIADKGRVHIVDYGQIVQYQIDDNNTGLPELVGFRDWTSGGVWPVPNANYTMSLQWSPKFTSWTPGDSNADSTSLNIPDDWLRTIIRFGGPKILQGNVKEYLPYTMEYWRQYIEFRNHHKGAGGVAGKSIIRQRDP